jgi:hypothetical protein
MEKVDMNVKDIVNIAVELEAKKTELANLKAQELLYKRLYEEEKAKKDDTKKVEIRITQPKRQYDYNSGLEVTKFVPVDVITTDLNSAVDKIKSELTVLKDAQIESQEEQIKQLTKKVKTVNESMQESLTDNQKAYDKYRKELVEKFEKKETNLKKEIEQLEEELEKERTNKTDAELEAKRLEEIATLKVRIQNLEVEIDELTGLSFFKRTWLWKSIINLQAKIRAYRTEAKNKVEADNVMGNYGSRAFWYGW